MNIALDDAELMPAAGADPIGREPLEHLAKEYLMAEAVIERVGRRIDPLVLHAVMQHPMITLDDPEAAAAAARMLAASVGSVDLQIEARYDERTESHALVIRRLQHGNYRTTFLDRDFIQSGDYAQIVGTGSVLQGLIREGATVRRGQQSRSIANFSEALEWLLDEARHGLAIQRYKGLGEMNPEQLWETTMDPAKRILLRTQIEDMISADEIFSKLMGDVVEPRREFIEANALGVRNLDV